jgi:outer membrane lipoprotein-sorting protein
MKAFAAAFLLVFLAGCATVAVTPPPPEARRYLKDPHSLLDQVQQRRGRFHDLRGLVEISLRSPRENYSGKAVLLLKAEGAIRLEALSFFGQPILYIVAQHKRLEAFSPREGRYFRGRATAHNIYQWLGIPLFPQEVVEILWGGIPAPVRRAQLRAEWDGSQGGSGSYRLEWLRTGKVVRRLWVDPQTLLPLRFQNLGPGQSALITVGYANYRDESGILLPEDVKVEVGPSERTLDLRYGKVSVNRGLAPLAFKLPVPKGTRVFPID